MTAADVASYRRDCERVVPTPFDALEAFYGHGHANGLAMHPDSLRTGQAQANAQAAQAQAHAHAHAHAQAEAAHAHAYSVATDLTYGLAGLHYAQAYQANADYAAMQNIARLPSDAGFYRGASMASANANALGIFGELCDEPMYTPAQADDHSPQFGPLTGSSDGSWTSPATPSSGWPACENGFALDADAFDVYASANTSADMFSSISNPGVTLHHRSDSGHSHSDGSECDHSDETYNPLSPESTASDITDLRRVKKSDSDKGSVSSRETSPIPSVEKPPRRRRSSASTKGKPSPRGKVTKRSPPSAVSPTVKAALSKAPVPKKDLDEKRIGKRTGPLSVERRGEVLKIRQMRACIRCKFLKKTCDDKDVCSGCKPSHARLWQVPCTRLDIRDLGYFLNGWSIDHDRVEARVMPTDNVVYFAAATGMGSARSLWVGHGYGYAFPVKAVEVAYQDNTWSLASWVETAGGGHYSFNACTANFEPTENAIDEALLSDYVDAHVEKGFSKFLSDHFQQTQFITDILRTAHDFQSKSGSEVVRKALKLVVAYNLTAVVTFIEGDSPIAEGIVKNPSSQVFKKTVAPNQVNNEVKHRLAAMWRDLHKDVLVALSQLFQGVYTGDKMKSWPEIVLVSILLLIVWEEIEFDARYHDETPGFDKLWSDVESIPVGVITGLFTTVAQKAPGFAEWDSAKHGHLVGSAAHNTEVMEKISAAMKQNSAWLAERAGPTWTHEDLDSLVGKFLSKLVVRA